MHQHTTSALRRGWAALLLAGLGVLAAPPAFGANDTCKANGFHISPNNQNNQARFNEYDAANNYARTIVHLGIDKTLDPGAVATWLQTGGPAVVLNTSNPIAPTFTAPEVGSAGATLQFTLTITCPGPGGATGSDIGTVSIIDVNRPPVAYASATPTLVYEGDTVTLRSTAPSGTPVSADPDGDTLAYAWSQVATPGAPGITLSGAGTATASFVAPVNPAGNYTLQFLLTVRDRATGGLTATAPVMVNVSRNLPPIARLTCPDAVDEGGSVVLDGSTSSDPQGGTLTYTWVQNTGSPDVQVGAETGSTVHFTAPTLTQGQDGFLEFWLTVSSGSGSDLATCWVQVVDATAPVLALPADIVVDADSPSGKAVPFAATAADAVDGPLAASCTPASGSTFALAAAPVQQKTSTVTCTAHDSAVRPSFPLGNVATGSFHVTVRDITAPLIDVPGSVGVEATGPDGAVATFDATTTDAVDGPGLAACTPASGTLFALGSTQVSCTAVDQRQNVSAPANFDVTVHDTTAPVITVPTAVTKEATGSNGAMVQFTATATDLVDGAVAVTCLPASGSSFPLGDTTVTCDAIDSRGNSTAAPGHVTSATFIVTVRDTTPPVITVPPSITAEATGPDGAAVTYTATAVDLVDGDVAVTCTPASGTTFALLTTPVTCDAVDSRGNSTADHGLSKTFTITVQDTTAPVISDVSADLVAEATSAAGAAVDFDLPTATDLVDGPVAVTCSRQPGETFALGTVTVTCDAVDSRGNSTATATPVASATFKITVQDTTAPLISGVSADVVAEATSAAGAVVGFDLPTAIDLVDGPVAVTCSRDSGDTFPLGATTVTCDAVDSHGNSTATANPVASATFKVTVRDTTPPALTVPSPIIREATGPAGAVVQYTASAIDLVDGSVTPVCTPASGATFAIQATTVTCTATDAHGNMASKGFDITVQDTTPPALTLPAGITAEATGPAGASVSFIASANDIVSGAVAVACSRNPGDSFGLGTTTVGCSAHDAAGNSATGSFTITVRDTTPPQFAAYADVYATASVNSQATVHFELPTASDLVDGGVAVHCDRLPDTSFVVGATTVTCTAADGRSPPNAATMTFRVHVSYAWTGFFRPVDNLPLTNTVKAGSAIPVKFALGGNQGLSVMAAGYPKSVQITCQTGAIMDAIEETVTAGGSSLTYDASANQYVYVWKSDKSWAGTCRQLQLKLADGTPAQVANFSFSR